MGIGWMIFYYLGKVFSRFRLSHGGGMGGPISQEAENILLKHGFKILDRGRKGSLITYVNGKSNLGLVQADFVVTKKKKTYVATIKSGEFSSDEASTALRRQLIENKFVFDPDGLLVVDINEGRLKRVEFGLPEQKRERFILFVVGLIIVSVLAGLIFIYIQAKLF